MKLRRHVLVVLALGLPACSGGSDGGPTGPQNADVAGQWDYLAMDLIGAIGGVPVRCALVGGLDLSQQSATLLGALFGRAIQCEVPNEILETGVVGDREILGGVTGAEVEFRYGVPFVLPQVLGLVEAELGAPVFDGQFILQHEGTVSGNSMSGTVTVEVRIGITGASRRGFYELVGTWSATR